MVDTSLHFFLFPRPCTALQAFKAAAQVPGLPAVHRQSELPLHCLLPSAVQLD
jgi:hypothetical protein